MVQSTPWQAAGSRGGQDPQRGAHKSISEGWPYLLVALANAAVLYLMFKPWLSAYGWDGTATVNAFGRFRRTTKHLNLWSQSPPPGPTISNTWAVLATTAILITVAAAVWASRQRSAAAETLTAVAASAAALLVAMDLYTLNAAIPQVGAALAMSKDLSAQLGLAIGALRGSNEYPWPGKESQLRTAGLTSTALFALAITVVAAAVTALRARRGLLRVIKAVVTRIL